MTERRSTRQTPFKLMFGSEAILTTEVELPTIKTDVGKLLEKNKAHLRRNLDLVDETRDVAAIRIAKYQ